MLHGWMRRRRLPFALTLFTLNLVVASGFAACTNLRHASPVDDAGGTDDTPDGTDGTEEPSDARTAPDRDASVDGSTSDADEDARSLWPFCQTSGSLCACAAYGIQVDSSACEATTFPSGFCCADPGWPSASSSTCTCGAWTCHTTGSGTCLCGAYPDGSPGSSCSDSFCCAHPTQSTCGCASTASAACPSAFADANNVPVASCAQATQPCPRGGTRVSSCTF